MHNSTDLHRDLEQPSTGRSRICMEVGTVLGETLPRMARNGNFFLDRIRSRVNKAQDKESNDPGSVPHRDVHSVPEPL